MLDRIKSFASFNVEIKKIDPKKESQIFLNQIIQKIDFPIHKLIIQTSPSEHLNKNDNFLKFLYENFYKIEFLDSLNTIKYVQEHDSNW